MKSPRSVLGISLPLLGLAAAAMAASSVSGKEPAPSRERRDPVGKASRAAETRIENALKGRSVMRTSADMAITARIKTALVGDQTVSASDINVDTLKGGVHLKGTVRSKAEAQRAVSVAKRTLGVKAVKNHLKVVPSGKTAGVREKSKTAASGKRTY